MAKGLLSKRGASPSHRGASPSHRPETPKSAGKKKVKKVKKVAKGKGKDALQSPNSIVDADLAEAALAEADVEVIFVDDLYALQRCANCTFFHFALCVNCPRCNEQQPNTAGQKEAVEQPGDQVIIDGTVGRPLPSVAEAGGIAPSVTAPSVTAPFVTAPFVIAPFYFSPLATALFAKLDVQKRGRLPTEALVSTTREHFRAQRTEQPELWVRNLIVKHSRDGEATAAEFARAVNCLLRM